MALRRVLPGALKGAAIKILAQRANDLLYVNSRFLHKEVVKEHPLLQQR